MLECTEYCHDENENDGHGYAYDHLNVDDNCVCLSYDECNVHIVNFFAALSIVQNLVECEYVA